MNKQKIFSIAQVAVLALIIAVGVSYTHAWTAPPGAPTACPAGYAGCDAPLNTGPTAQSKAGSLSLNSSSTSQNPVGLYVFGQTVLDNSALASSAVKIIDGSQHAGYVLTSDGSGNATWAAPASGSVGPGAIANGTAKSSDGTTTITLPSGTWNLTVFMGYPNCIDNSITLKLDGTTIGTRTGFGDQEGCNDSTISGTASGVAGGSHKLSVVGFDTSSFHGQQFWYWTATSGSVNVIAASTGKVYWEEDNKNTNGDNRLWCDSASGNGFCNSVGSDAVSMGCSDGNVLQDYVASSTYNNDWTSMRHVGYCVAAPN